MNTVILIEFVLYMVVMLGVGLCFARKNLEKIYRAWCYCVSDVGICYYSDMDGCGIG